MSTGYCAESSKESRVTLWISFKTELDSLCMVFVAKRLISDVATIMGVESPSPFN